MKKLVALLLILLLMPMLGLAEAADEPTPAPEPKVIVTANYKFWETYKFIHKDATLRVYSDGRSEMILHFINDGARSYNARDDFFIRLIKVDGVEGNYGQAPLVLTGEGNSYNNDFSATVPFDRAFGKSKTLIFALCRGDGKELERLKYKLDTFTSDNNKWPEPENTPPIPTIPPVKATPTPTPKPTFAPDTTEPPQDTALVTVAFRLREPTANFTGKSARLRIFDEMSVLTLEFTYTKELPEGSTIRMTVLDARKGYYGEGSIVRQSDGTYKATIFYPQQVGYFRHFDLEAYAPGATTRSFKVSYNLHSSTSSLWTEFDPITPRQPAATPTPTPLPENVTPTPAPTAPPEDEADYHASYELLDPVKHFSLQSATRRRYADGLVVLEIKFTYTAELPANGILRVTQKQQYEGNFGEAVIVKDKNTDNQFTVTIITDQLQGSLQAFRMRCYDAKGNEQFYADFAIKHANASWDDGYLNASARRMLPTPTPEPDKKTPTPTITVAPTPDPEASSTPAPTEPPFAEARHKRVFRLMDKVKKYSNYNTTLRRYQEFDVLTVTFRYSGELPEGAVMRLTQVDTLIDSFGEALIQPANLKNASEDLLSAKIVSDRIPLNCKGLRLKVYGPDGEELFTADYIADENGVSTKDVTSMLNAPTPTPSSTATPEATPQTTPEAAP